MISVEGVFGAFFVGDMQGRVRFALSGSVRLDVLSAQSQKPIPVRLLSANDRCIRTSFA